MNTTPKITAKLLALEAGLTGKGPSTVTLVVLPLTYDGTGVGQRHRVVLVRRSIPRHGWRWQVQCQRCRAPKRQVYITSANDLLCQSCAGLAYPTRVYSGSPWFAKLWPLIRHARRQPTESRA